MGDDFLIASLKRLCQRFDSDPLQGRHAVSKATGLSEQYLYQIIAGKAMANGKKRNIGTAERARITEKFPDWLDKEETSGRPPGVSEPEPIPYTHPHPIVRQVIGLMDATDDAGKGIVLMAASQALDKYRPIKETAA